MQSVMSDIELLDLISKGDTEHLLMQKNLTTRLNIMVSNGLIDICEGKIIITEKGNVIKNDRKLFPAENTRMLKDMEEFSNKTLKRNSLYVYLSFSLLCTSALLFFYMLLNGI